MTSTCLLCSWRTEWILIGHRRGVVRDPLRVTLVTDSVFTTKYDRFRELIVDARRRADLTQAQVALKIGRPQSFVSKYERGERRLDVIEFLAIARAIGIEAIPFIKQLDDSD
jgi:ribosome-binding protein aMBF1 (putative translation factor)